MKRTVGVVIVIAVAGGYVLSTGETDNSEVALQCRDDECRIELFTVGDRPVNQDPDIKVKILVNHGYVVGYSEARRNPLWAAYVASKLPAGTNPVRCARPQFFLRDIRAVPAVDGRTFGGGYTRGHMVPNAAIGTQYATLAQMETFFMTNVCPQKAELNQGPWMNLEKWIPQATQARKQVYVICGPIFGKNPNIVQNGPKRGIHIPEAFYMILVDMNPESPTRSPVDVLAYRFPQNTAPDADFKDRQQYGTCVDEIERQTKLDFFPSFDQSVKNWDQKEAEIAAHW